MGLSTTSKWTFILLSYTIFASTYAEKVLRTIDQNQKVKEVHHQPPLKNNNTDDDITKLSENESANKSAFLQSAHRYSESDIYNENQENKMNGYESAATVQAVKAKEDSKADLGYNNATAKGGVDVNVDENNEGGDLKFLNEVQAKEKTVEEELDFEAPEQREVDEAVEYGLNALKELMEIKEPKWYQMGLYLDKNDPASYVARFSAPRDETLQLTRFGFAALEASRKLSETYPQTLGRQRTGIPASFKAEILSTQCPLHGLPRCPEASRRYRTADGTCNNFDDPWKGASLLPMQRFLPPSYDDGVQSIRRSVFREKLPSARDISIRIHRDRNHEMPTVTLMFMQWGQFLDHDLIQSAQARSFNNSVPRCCERGGLDFLPLELLHPSCLPIEVSSDDWFLGPFGIRCIEFIRSAPTSRIDCDLGWREQINQVTPYIDASTIYGSDPRSADSTRIFRGGLLQYGRPRNQGPLQPPDPSGGELCRAGALTTECFNSGDGRVGENPALTAFHTIWIRYHNQLASGLQKFNPHWSDEKLYQEARKIVGALVQHISYREFLPLVLGQEVMKLFDLNFVRKGYYNGYNSRINPAIANSFGTAAFRFGHSLVQNSFVRTDIKHRPIFNNVSLHLEQENVENIWSIGSLDRLILGLSNQPSQKRDEFVADELTNHLFQSPSFPFGMDLASINIQRGRDHGLPGYTAWREPCGLSRIQDWKDLQKIMPVETAQRFRSLYRHVDDIDLFPGGLAEYPVRGGIVGPTFACIIAQQFLNLRKGDRFWYENGDFDSSFTPAQLQQIRKSTFAQIICQTMAEIETIQPFVFLTADEFRNVRLPCNSPLLADIDLTAWTENKFNEVDSDIFEKHADNRLDTATDQIVLNFEGFNKEARSSGRKKNKRTKTTTYRPMTEDDDVPLKFQITNITTEDVENKYSNGYGQTFTLTNIPQRPQYNDYNNDFYNYQTTRRTMTHGKPVKVSTQNKQSTQKPLEVNIQIQYILPNGPTTPRPLTNSYNRPSNNAYGSSFETLTTKKTKSTRRTTKRPVVTSYPIYIQNNYQTTKTPKRTTKRPYSNRPQNSYQNNFNDDYDYYKPQNSYSNQNKPYISSYNKPTTTSRPYIYRPSNNFYIFSDDYWVTTRRPYLNNYGNYPKDPPTTKYPSYLYLDTDDDYNYKKKPQKRPYHGHGGYNRDDPIDEIYSEAVHSDFVSDSIPKKPSFGLRETDQKNKFNYDSDDDDFKTDSTTKHKLPDVISDTNKNFVKISSIHGDAFDDFEDSREYKEGDLNLNEPKDDASLRVVRIDVIPSEIRKDQWLLYNATEEESPLPLVPELNAELSFSNEIPRPMNFTYKNYNKSSNQTKTDKLTYNVTNMTNVFITNESDNQTMTLTN